MDGALSRTNMGNAVRSLRLLGVVGSFLLVAACGSSKDDGSTKGSTDPTTPAPDTTTTPSSPTAPPPPATPDPDHGSVSTKYPAFKPDFATLQNKGGQILTAPKIVSVVWSDNPNVATYEQISDTIGATQYWKQIVGEYGVGPATSGAANHIHETSTITLSTDPNVDPVDTIAQFISDKLTNIAVSKWPAPTDQTIYSLFLSGPVAAALCDEGAGGLHDSFRLNGKNVAYALINECSDPGEPAPAVLQDTTISASHEFAEASVDPYPDASPAWQGLDGDHLAWELMVEGQDENADMCEDYADAYGQVSTELPFFLQRQWSNTSSAAGHAPCVPQGADAYFNMAPIDAPEALSVSFPADAEMPPSISQNSKGYKVAVGATRKIALGFNSDAATADFAVTAFEMDPFDFDSMPMTAMQNPNVTIAFDKQSGQNGEKTFMSVTVNKNPALGASLVLVATTLGNTTHMLPMLIGVGAAGGSTTGNTGNGANMKKRGKGFHPTTPTRSNMKNIQISSLSRHFSHAFPRASARLTSDFGLGK